MNDPQEAGARSRPSSKEKSNEASPATRGRKGKGGKAGIEKAAKPAGATRSSKTAGASGSAAAATGSAKDSPPGAGGKRRSGEKRARLNESLRLELHALRSGLAQILAGYEVKIGGVIAELLDRLEGDESLDQPPRPLTVAQAQAALETLAAVSIRPERARLKDLRRIRDAVRRLRQQIPD